jgi:CHAD domain-containing protein
MSALELALGDRSPQDLVGEALRGWFSVGYSPGLSHGRVYYDTFDGRLHARGLALSYQRSRLLLEPLEPDDRRLNGEPTQTPMAAEPELLRAATLPPGRLGSAVAGVIGKRALLPLVRLRVHAEVMAVLDERDKTVVRVLCEAAELVDGPHDGVKLGPRLRVVGLRGYEQELAHVIELLAAAADVEPIRRPLLDEAVITDGRDPVGVGTRVQVPLQPRERADQATASVLGALAAMLDATLPGTIAGVDTEFLHDYRVAVRRTRSVLREFAGVFDDGRLRKLREELRWLQDVTGPTRDYDVYVQDFQELLELTPETLHDDYQPLLELLEERRAAARMEMEDALQSQRAAAVRRLLGQLIAHPGGGGLAARPIGELTAARIRHLHHRMIKMGSEIDPGTPPHDYHQLRKRGKELRYLLELFGEPLYDPEVVRALVRTLKGLQDVLGRHQDREIQITVQRSLADEAVRGEDGVTTLLAMGVLIDRLEEDAARARGEFADAFTHFASAQQRKLVRWTFRAPDPEESSDAEEPEPHGLGEEL